MIADAIPRCVFAAGSIRTFLNALELDRWVIWASWGLLLPRRSRTRRLQGAGEVSEYPGLRTGGSERKLDAACGRRCARLSSEVFRARSQIRRRRADGFWDSVTQFEHQPIGGGMQNMSRIVWIGERRTTGLFNAL